MNLGFITTSRADFGIFLPLLQAIQKEGWPFFIFAGGMHTSSRFGNSYKLIENEYQLPVAEKISSLTDDDSSLGIGHSMGLTTFHYSDVWEKYHDKLDLVFALGDRFEMFSAAVSVLPFNIPIAHLHGGETTLGAIDNKFRHALTAIAEYHFVSSQIHAEKVVGITGSTENVYNVGALGLDGIRQTEFYSPDEFLKKFDFDVNDQFVLVTYHPETVDLRNELFIGQLIEALQKTPFKVLCTLPNADTQGSLIRDRFLNFEKNQPEKIKCFENLGQKGYLTAMKYCFMMIGNTSSGIIEAASFNKPVVNVGDRQKGRLAGENVIHVENDAEKILEGINHASRYLTNRIYENPYGDGTASKKIIEILKKKS